MSSIDWLQLHQWLHSTNGFKQVPVHPSEFLIRFSWISISSQCDYEPCLFFLVLLCLQCFTCVSFTLLVLLFLVLLFPVLLFLVLLFLVLVFLVLLFLVLLFLVLSEIILC